jgi:phage protein U
MLLALGLFVFENLSVPFTDISRRTAWRHARSARVGARDASQYVGPGDDTISLSGVLLPGYAGDFASMRKLRAMADEGEAWPLVTGTGDVLGSFVILSIDERGSTLMVDGVPRKVDFAVELDRVG